MTSLHVICGLGPPQSKILATPMEYDMFTVFLSFDRERKHYALTRQKKPLKNLINANAELCTIGKLESIANRKR